MDWWAILVGALLIGSGRTCLADQNDDWPTRLTLDNGVEIGIKGLLQYDNNDFDHDQLSDGTTLFDDARTWRRKEVNLYAGRKGAFELNAGYDFQARQWLDNYLSVDSAIGSFRIGQFKTPVGWENGSTSSGATTFLERSLPEQAVYEGRRAGLEWTWGGLRKWLFQAAYFGPHDLNDDANGNTLAARAALAPVLDGRQVVHLALSASRELRDDRTARVRARPEVALTPIRLVDTGTLQDVDRIDRRGLEAAWADGPLLVQSEFLTLRAHRFDAREFTSQGYYVSTSWLLTGESRPYKAGAFSNPPPHRAFGAFELALRYSTLDLNDGAVAGGREHDWTLGVNWYLGTHFKFQANYIRAFSDHGNLQIDPTIYGLRAQITF